MDNKAYDKTSEKENGGQSVIGTPGEDVHLKREMGLWSAVSIIVGTIIGSGIFISPKGIAEGSGSVGFSLVNWAICGFVSSCGALCMAELGTMFSKNGGYYVYLKEGLGDLPAFLHAQLNTLLLGPAALALSILTSAQYITLPFFDDDCGDSPKFLRIITAIFLIGVLCAINIWSVKLALKIQLLFTVVKIAVLCIIIIGGFVKLAEGNTENLSTGFEGTESNIGKIAVGLYNGMYAYSGWATLNFVAGEVKDPSRNIPLAIFIAMPLVTVIYILANVSYFTVMSIEELLDSPAVGITWADRVLGPFSWIIPVGVAMSTFGGFMSGGRLAYSCSRDGHTPEIFSMVHVKYFTPMVSLLQVGIMTMIFSIPSDTSSLLDFFSFVAWSFDALVMIALIVMRYTKKDVKRSFKVPLILPIFMAIVSLFLVFGPFFEEILVEYVYSIAAMILLAVLYFPFIHKRYKLPGMDSFTKCVQLFLQVVPPTTKDN